MVSLSFSDKCGLAFLAILAGAWVFFWLMVVISILRKGIA